MSQQDCTLSPVEKQNSSNNNKNNNNNINNYYYNNILLQQQQFQNVFTLTLSNLQAKWTKETCNRHQ